MRADGVRELARVWKLRLSARAKKLFALANSQEAHKDKAACRAEDTQPVHSSWHYMVR
jgi:hypothetical protein